MNTQISRRIEWDMGHRIPNHESLCRNPHGHRYVAEIVIKGPVIDTASSPKQGMVEDFGLLKELLQERILSKLDHGFMVFKEDPFAGALAQFERNHGRINIIEVEFVPTAENIAAYIFKRMQNSGGFEVVEVTVWETPNCKAVVTK